MDTFFEAMRFSRPYLGRYWPRFVLGIVLGMLFGLSNGLFVGAVFTVVHRFADPAHVEANIDKGLEAEAEEKEAKENPTLHSFKAEGATLKQEYYILIDPWLPMRGRAIDWKQCLGGFMFIPLAIILRGILGYGSSYLLAWCGQRITNDVKSDAFRKINSLSLDFFQKTTTNELISRIESDGTALNNFLKMGLSDLVKEPSTMFWLLAMMLLIDWRFTIVALIFTPLCIIPTRIVTKKIKELGKKDFESNVGQGSITMESFQNVRITKAYGLEEVHSQIFWEGGRRSMRFNMKQTQSREILGPIVQTLSAMGISLVLLYAISSHAGYDKITAFVAALFAFTGPVKKMNHLGVYFTQLSIALDRLVALFKLQPTVREAENPVAMGSFKKSLNFKDVSFSYGDAPVLQGVSFSLTRGQKLGLAGESGSGKSSLLNLLFRFYDPTGGRIEIDGVPITAVSIMDLRRQLALVSQDVLLFNATVAENISYGKIGATREEVVAAAREAYAHDFIEALPKGYDTPLGERGLRLSGGQRQRIAIARAFIRNAPILVLDEATASLDSQAEAEVQKAIDHLAEHRTVVCVAHRLSTLRSMDKILVLEKGGRLVEQGGFEELLVKGGIFSKMAAAQGIFPQATTV